MSRKEIDNMRTTLSDHCIVLLHHCADRGPIVSTVGWLAAECGIPPRSLYEILEDAEENMHQSILWGVAHGYPMYDFKVYRGCTRKPETMDRVIIDVVSVH